MESSLLHLDVCHVRCQSYFLYFIVGFPSDFKPFTPGLETKFALEEAEKLGSNIYFGGSEFDPITIESLRTETDMYAHTAFWKGRVFLQNQNAWNTDFSDFFNTLHTRGG